MAKLPPYKYIGLPIMKETIREIFDIYWSEIPVLKKGGIISRAEIIHAVQDFHIRNKGKKSDSTGNVNRILKEYAWKYPNRVNSSGARGYWNLNLSSKKVAAEKKIKPGGKATPKKPEFTLTPKKIFGRGQNKVYVFYDKSSKGCKVGKTRNTIEARYAQFKTAIVTPWSLEVLLMFESHKEMDIYEQTLKNILKMNKYQPTLVPKGNGTEHFSISPKKILTYISKLNSY